jgi:AAA domain
MSRRVRHTSGTAEEAQAAGSRAGQADSAASAWNASFHGFSADDRARILALALPAGIVYAQQLPDPKVARQSDERLPSIFAPFLNGRAEHLVPTKPKPVVYFDNELDRWQKEAVAKSLVSPDLFLLRGHPGSGKSRVLVEVIRQAIARGDRVLFLSQSSAALDRVLSALSAAGEILAIRCLQPDESKTLLRPEIRATLLESRVSELALRARNAGHLELAASQRECQEIDRAQASWPVLVDLLSQRLQLETDRHERKTRQATLDQELATSIESSDFATVDGEFVRAWSAWTKEADRKRTAAGTIVLELEGSLAETKSRLAQLQAENANLSPFLHARTGGRFWTPAWWKALLKPAETRRAAEVAQLLLTCRGELEQQERTLASALVDRQRTEEETALDRTRLLDQERTRRHAALSAEIGKLEAANTELARRWQDQCRPLPELANRSIANQNELAEARQDLAEARARAVASGLRAEQWLALLDRHPHALRDALIENSPVVAATATGWAADRELAARLSSKPFDLLILEDAEQFSETECASYARLARRWLFVGSDNLLDHELEAAPRGVEERQETVQLQHPVFFGQLWQRLHSNPERLPYAWVEDGDKLVCRLRSIHPEQRTWIETERLADHPQIVLHILALPRSRPVVAEVVFPAAFTIQRAKQFILQELQELAVHAPARSMRWHDDHSERLVLQLAGQVCNHPAAVALAPGIKEMLNPRQTAQAGGTAEVAWQTCCIEFDRLSGWQRGAAEDWIERHLGLRDIGRTLFLDGLHRFSVTTGAFVKTLISSQINGAPAAFPESLVAPQSVEFVGVPTPTEGGRTERNAAGARVRAAGFEVDLSDFKNRERLTSELYAGLPAQGIVNLSEAQAIARRLVDCERSGSLPAASAGQVAVFIIALYEAQAELIRRLLRNTPSLAPRSHSIEVGVPQSFTHRDAPWVFLSLTRSHSHRATAFGAGPKDLLLALSRAREKMFVFGDPGALARRVHWEGPVERYDALQARQERDLVRTLLAGFQNTAHSPTASVGSEGFGT